MSGDSPRYELWKLERKSNNGAGFKWMAYDFYGDKVAHFFLTREVAENWIARKGE